jgi:hypothetical protein
MEKKIKPIEYLVENYDEVSEWCDTHNEPMFLTKDGEIKLVIMSIKLYEKLTCACDDANISQDESANAISESLQ